MWEKILNLEAINFIKKVAEEEDDNINAFFNRLKENAEDYENVIAIARRWDTYEETRQVSISIGYAGIFHASRFIILMDYLNMKSKKGEL